MIVNCISFNQRMLAEEIMFEAQIIEVDLDLPDKKDGS